MKGELSDIVGGCGSDGNDEPWAKQTALVHWDLGKEPVITYFAPVIFFV